MLSTYDKDMLYENIFKLKACNENRETPIFITEHLPKIFYNQKNLLIPQFQAAKREKKRC